MRYRHHRTITIPAAFAVVANAELERHGYGPDNFSIELGRNRAELVAVAGSGHMDDAMLSVVRGIVARTTGAVEHQKTLEQVETDEGINRRDPDSGEFETRRVRA